MTTPDPAIPGVTIYSSAKVPEDYGRWLIHGPQGSGKTSLAATIAESGKTLFIDFTGEKGVRSFRGAAYAENIDVARPDSITALDDLFWWIDKGEHDYAAVVLDSITAIQKMTMRYLLGHDETAVREIKQGAAPADMRTWGQALDVMQDMATFWYGLADGQRARPIHVVMTAQTKITEDEETGRVTRTPDVQRGALSISLAAPDYVVYTDVEEDLDASDDELAVRHVARFGAHPGYRTKARVPVNLRGKVPPVLGRRTPLSLTALSRVLGIGGIPAAPRKPAADRSADTSKEK